MYLFIGTLFILYNIPLNGLTALQCGQLYTVTEENKQKCA